MVLKRSYVVLTLALLPSLQRVCGRIVAVDWAVAKEDYNAGGTLKASEGDSDTAIFSSAKAGWSTLNAGAAPKSISCRACYPGSAAVVEGPGYDAEEPAPQAEVWPFNTQQCCPFRALAKLGAWG